MEPGPTTGERDNVQSPTATQAPRVTTRRPSGHLRPGDAGRALEGSASSTPVAFDRAVTAGSDVAATPIQPGEVETSVTVTVRWSLG